MGYLGLPNSVMSRVEFKPVEDVALKILRDAFPDLNIVSLVPDDPTFPLILVRSARDPFSWGGDPRFVDTAMLDVNVYVPDPDADEKGALISEAIRVALRDAWLAHVHLPGLGSIASIELRQRPRAVIDWATAVGPVQYADLPSGVTRYESRYHLEIRREL